MKNKLDKLILSGIIFTVFIGITGYSTGMIYGKSLDEKDKASLMQNLENSNKEDSIVSEKGGENGNSEIKNNKDTIKNDKKSDKDKKTIPGHKSDMGTKSYSGSPTTPIPKNLKDGVYYGQAKGYDGQVKVKVSVEKGKIKNIDVLSHSETPEYFEKGLKVIDSILSAQNTNVDSVSGATFTSNAIKNAVANALKSAGGSSSNPSGSSARSSNTAPSNTSKSNDKYKTENENLKKQIANLINSNSKIDKSKLKDGTYEGVGLGYENRQTKVKVKIENQKISKIDIVSTGDDEPFFSNAKSKIINGIIEKNTTSVDVVSNATYSSNGIKSAVNNALEKAIGNSTSNSGYTKILEDRIKNLEKELRETKEQLKNKKEEDKKEYEENNHDNSKEKNEFSLPENKKNGTFTGKAKGHKGEDVLVEVKTKEGKIVDINIKKILDDMPFVNKSMAVKKLLMKENPSMIFKAYEEFYNLSQQIENKDFDRLPQYLKEHVKVINYPKDSAKVDPILTNQISKMIREYWENNENENYIKEIDATASATRSAAGISNAVKNALFD